MFICHPCIFGEVYVQIFCLKKKLSWFLKSKLHAFLTYLEPKAFITCVTANVFSQCVAWPFHSPNGVLFWPCWVLLVVCRLLWLWHPGSRARGLGSCNSGLLLVVVCVPRHPIACGILVSQAGIEPKSPALEGRFLTTGPQMKPQQCLLKSRHP